MTDTANARLLSPEEIAVRAGGEIPFLRFAERGTVFAEREMRLRQLAAGHSMGDYLRFVADVAHAQGEVLTGKLPVDLPSDAQIEAAARAGTAPFAAPGWKRDPRWTTILRDVMRRLSARLPEGTAKTAVAALIERDDAWLDAQADRLQVGVMLGLDLASAPLVAAGLQVYFTHLVLATRDANEGARLAPFGRVDDPAHCPCCASRPIASVVRIGAAEAGYRYLACSLCATQWHLVRIKCAHCQSTKGITYQSLDLAGREAAGGSGSNVEGSDSVARPVELECCEECGHYLKIVHMQRDPEVEPAADDLATITLDLLAGESGTSRHGVNLMLLFGDPDAPAEPTPAPRGGGG